MAQSRLQAVVLWAATSVHRWVKPAAPILPPQVPGSPPASCGGVPGGGQLGGQSCRMVPGQLVPGWRVKVPKLGEGCCLAPAPSPAPRRTALGTPSGHPSKQRLGRAEGAGKSSSPPAPPGHGCPEPVQHVQAPGAALGALSSTGPGVRGAAGTQAGSGAGLGSAGSGPRGAFQLQGSRAWLHHEGAGRAPRAGLPSWGRHPCRGWGPSRDEGLDPARTPQVGRLGPFHCPPGAQPVLAQRSLVLVLPAQTPLRSRQEWQPQGKRKKKKKYVSNGPGQALQRASGPAVPWIAAPNIAAGAPGPPRQPSLPRTGNTGAV